MSNPKRRESDGSLIADLRRRVSWLEQRRTPAGAKKLDDLSDVAVPTPATNDVLTYTGSVWTSLPSVAGDIAVSEALASYSDDGIFSEASYFNFQPQFVVAANSHQLAIVTAYVDGISNIDLAVTGTGLPGDAVASALTPWRVYALDATPDPDGPEHGAMGTGAGRVTFPIWMHNTTDTEATHTLYISVESVFGMAYEFDATVTVRAESVFQMAAIP